MRTNGIICLINDQGTNVKILLLYKLVDFL
jgi:hypothetical protein